MGSPPSIRPPFDRCRAGSFDLQLEIRRVGVERCQVERGTRSGSTRITASNPILENRNPFRRAPEILRRYQLENLDVLK